MRGRNYSACSMLERMFTNSVRLVASLVVLQVSNADELAAERLSVVCSQVAKLNRPSMN